MNPTSLKENNHGVIPYAGNDNLTLYDIEDGLVAAICNYEEAADALRRYEGSMDALEYPELAQGLEDDLQLAEEALRTYLSEEVRKVNGIAGYIRFCDARHEEAKKEAERVANRAKAWEARRDRVKQMTLSIMQQFGVPRFETATSVIRRQKNGGVPSPVIDSPAAVPDRFVRIECKMTAETFKRMPSELVQEIAVGERSFMLRDIAKALKADDVPGCRAGEAGEHLRVE